jgi:hypothetical protein
VAAQWHPSGLRGIRVLAGHGFYRGLPAARLMTTFHLCGCRSATGQAPDGLSGKLTMIVTAQVQFFLCEGLVVIVLARN